MLFLQTRLLVYIWLVLTLTHALPIPEQPKCPNYERQSRTNRDSDPSVGRYALPFQRPTPECRTYHSEEVEEAIARLKPKIADPDLYRLF